MAFLIHLLKKGDTFIDVGANLGSYTLLSSGICDCKSIAYEPVPTTYSKLVKNVSIQNFREKITTKKIALTSKDFNQDKILFSIDRGCCNSIIDKHYEGEKEYVQSSNLDKETENINPSLLKIDVEGFEIMVLKGAINCLKRSSLLAIIIEGQTDEVNLLIKSQGFIDFNYDPLNRKLTPHHKKLNNRIWIKKSNLNNVQKRLKNKKFVNLYGHKI